MGGCFGFGGGENCHQSYHCYCHPPKYFPDNHDNHPNNNYLDKHNVVPAQNWMSGHNNKCRTNQAKDRTLL
eukprot:2093850-Ditylum_brightwellii.AAC.1